MKIKYLLIFNILLLFVTQGVAQKKNVLFIAVDDLKPLIGAYGDPFAKTPNMDRLASRGFLFRQAYVQQAVCAPSRASMLTGLRPDLTKVWDLNTMIRDKNPHVMTLPQLFKQNGWQTHAIGKVFDPRSVDQGHDSRSWTIPYVVPDKLPGSGPKPALGYYQSEETVTKIKFYEKLANSRGLKGEKKNAFIRKNIKPSTEKANVPDDAYLDGRILNAALEKIDQFATDDRPFMLMVGFKKPHLPFVAPAKYWDLYDRKKMPLAKFQKHSKGGPALAYHNNPELRAYTDIPEAFNEYDELNIEKQRELVHGYYAAVSYIDAQIGKLLDKLREKGLDKNTIIVLWGDHGYHLGDHGLWCKHTNFEQATRMPLIFAGPGIEPGNTDIPVETLDIFPTVCELAGVNPDKDIQGKSLTPFFHGNETDMQYAVSQWPTRGYKGGMGYSIRTRQYRYTEWYKSYRSTRPRNEQLLIGAELYDYETDPAERRNLVKNKKYADVLKKHQKLLHDFLDNQAQKARSKNVKTAAGGHMAFMADEIPGKPKGTPLRQLVEKNFKPGTVYIGATIDHKSINTPKSTLLAEQFSYTTPENAVKQGSVHPKPDKWDWSRIDKIVRFAAKNDIVVRLHGPVSPQASKWAKADNRTPEELLQIMTEYMTEECKHFAGNKTVKWMDVVNETVAKGGKWFGPKPGTDQWENPWLAIGLNNDGIPIYIEKAFAIATKHADPDIKLVYNQHLTMEPAVWEKVKSTVLYLRKKGYRVDGIGWQAHLKEHDNVGLDPKALKYLGKLIDWAHANDLEFHVTEITYKLEGNFDAYAAQKQALSFANILKVLLSKRQTGVVTYNTWGLQDGKDQYNDGHRFIFDEQLRAKPAYYAIQKVLENPDDLELVFKVPTPVSDNNPGVVDNGMIINGGFEDGLDNWIKWGSCDVVDDQVHSGNHAVAIGPKSGLKQKVTGLHVGKKYVLSAWIKNSEGDKITVKVETDKESEGARNRAADTQFTKVEVPFVAKKKNAEIIIQKWGKEDKGLSWVDDISLTEAE